MTRRDYFGSHGEDLLLDRYREDYWYVNEMQLAGVCWKDAEYQKVQERMKRIVELLGYVPAP